MNRPSGINPVRLNPACPGCRSTDGYEDTRREPTSYYCARCGKTLTGQHRQQSEEERR